MSIANGVMNDSSGTSTVNSMKPKNTKSRNGCLTCKKKRLKCDETKPACLKCIKKNIECGGYATRFKWRSFNDNSESDSKHSADSLHSTTIPNSTTSAPTPSTTTTTTTGGNPSATSLHTSISLGPPSYQLEKASHADDSDMKRSNSLASTVHSVDEREGSKVKHEFNSNHVSPSNGASKSPNSLRRHLELASLSITGKSIKDIKIENDLIEEGFDPVNYMRRHRLENTSRNNAKLFANLGDSSLNIDHGYDHEHDDVNNQVERNSRIKRLKRSQSVSDNSLLNKPTGMVRSLSSNSALLPHSVSELRSQQARVNSLGLNSLAEAAIDEINTRSPGNSQSPYNNNNNSNNINHPGSHSVPVLSPSMSEFLAPSSNKSPEIMGQSSKLYQKSPVSTDGRIMHHQHSNRNQDNQVSRHHHQFQHGGNVNSHSHHHRLGGSNQTYSDLNLSPSLSALINTAFNNDNDIKNLNLQDDGFNLDFPLSPLNLQQGDPLHDFMTAVPAASPVTMRESSIHANNPNSQYYSNTNTPGLNLLAPNSLLVKQDESEDNLDKKKLKGQTPATSFSTPLTVSVEHEPMYNVLSTLSIVLSAEQEQILGLYAQYTAGILSIKNGPNENPWRNTILPLALHYSCLFNSIASVTLFHVAGNEAIVSNRDNLRARGYMYMKRCILELASGLSASGEGLDPSSKALPADIALATCLNLAVSETWDKHTSSGIAHLKGAKTMIQNILALLRETQQQLITKKAKLLKSSPPNEKDAEDYSLSLKAKKEQLKKKLVFVEDVEWNSILAGIDENELGNDNMAQVDSVSGHDSKKNESKTPNEFGNNPNLADKKKDSLIRIPRSTQFLFNVWIYFEVLAQMTTESDEKGIDLVATITSIMHDTKKKGRKSSKSFTSEDLNDNSPEIKSESSDLATNSIGDSGQQKGFGNFFENFEGISLNTDEVDPLLGCAQSLFLIMGKVATLISKIRKSRKKDANLPVRNTLFTITMATQLRQQLLSWKPTISKSMFEQGNNSVNNDPSSSEIFSSIATAEAYRFSALLYLHQAVPEIPSSSSHQLAEKIFILLASIPTSSPTYTIHIFPLLVSSCEAESVEEREWCENRWKLLSNKLWIGNVDRAFEVVKEVWKRKDDYIRKKQSNSLSSDDVFISAGNENDNEKLKSISSQLSGLMAAINGDQGPVDDITGGIYSKLHWSTIMKEWGWEVLLG